MRNKKKAARCSSIKAAYEINSQVKFNSIWLSNQVKFDRGAV